MTVGPYIKTRNTPKLGGDTATTLPSACTTETRADLPVSRVNRAHILVRTYTAQPATIGSSIRVVVPICVSRVILGSSGPLGMGNVLVWFGLCMRRFGL